MSTEKRFKVALSFPGEKREFVEQVAGHLVDEFGKSNIFYDKYHEDELARPNLDIYLLNIYKDQSDLVVLFLCEEYDKKEWCGVEWRAVREMVKKKQDNEIMPFKFDNFEIDGALSIDGFVDVKDKTSEKVAQLIIKRINKVPKQIVTGTVSDLQNIEGKLAELTAIVQNQIGNTELQNQIVQLRNECDLLRHQLLETEEVKEQNKKLTEELEKSLSSEKEERALKQHVLQAIEEKNYDKAECLLKEAAEDRIKQVAADFYQLGNVKELKLEYRPALEYYETAAKISPDNTDYLFKAATLCKDMGYYKNALSYIDSALKIEQNKESSDKSDIAKYINSLGYLANMNGEYDKAIVYFKQALVIDQEYYGESHPEIAAKYNNLGLAWKLKGEYDKAIEYYEQALAIDKQYYGESHPDIAIDYNNIGSAFVSKGAYDKGIEYYYKALAIDKQYYGESHPNIATRYNNLGTACRANGKHNEAIDYYKKAIYMLLQFYDETHPYIQISRQSLEVCVAEKTKKL